MSVRAVIFDFGGVICFPPTEAQWEEAAAYCDVPVETFHAAFWRDREAYDQGGDPQAYWRQIGRELGKSFDEATIAGLMQREIVFWSNFDERVLAWARQLKQAGIRTGILSNLPSPLGARLRTIPGFLDHFDDVTFSYELDVIKPQRGIYEHAVRGLAIAPGEGLFLDDRRDNVEGAIATGLKAEVFVDWEQFLDGALRKYSLPVPGSL